jgi:hypothetical protein
MGKTKRNSDYKNFVDSDKNNLMVIKPKKIVEQVRTFDGEEDFVVQRNNTYLDKGLIVQTNNNPDSIVDVVGVSDSVYKNAGGQITLNGSVSTSANGAYVQISGGQQPYQSVTYTFGSGTGQQSGTASGSSFGVNANFDQANNCYQGGQYNLSVSVTDANGDTGQYTWGGTIQGTCAVSSGSGGSGSGVSVQGNVGLPIGTATQSSGSGVSVQGNVGLPIGTATQSSGSGVSVQGNVGLPIATATPTPTSTQTQVFATSTSPIATYNISALSGLNVNAVLVGANDIEVNVSYNGGIPQYTILYVTYKDGNIINSATQSSSTNNDVYVASGLADGNYTFKVNVSDSNNNDVSTISNMINITTTPSVGTPSTGQTGLTPPTGSVTPPPTTTTGGTPSTGQAGQTGGATTTPPPTSTTTPTSTTPPTSTTTSGTTILGGGFQTIEKPIYLERETIVEFETFYSKNKFPIWLLIAIGVYFVATNKNN